MVRGNKGKSQSSWSLRQVGVIMQPTLHKIMKRAHMINELRDRFNYTNVEEKDDDQLLRILTHLRARDINHDHPSDKWF